MNINYNVIRLKYDGFEKKGFVLDRPKGTNDYLFLHFKTPVNILNDNEMVSILPGTCLITTPNTRHWFSSPDCDLVHDWIHFIPDNPEEFLKLGFPVNKLFNPLKVNFITPTIMNCESEFIHKELYYEGNISSMLSTMFIKLARDTLNNEDYYNSKYLLKLKDDFKKFRFNMYNNTDKNWTVDDMAKEMSLSRSRFTVLYRKFFDISPKDDLIAARIEQAKYLLLSSNIKVSEIAEKIGYTNIYHFIRQFKNITKFSPNAYRNQNIW